MSKSRHTDQEDPPPRPRELHDYVLFDCTVLSCSVFYFLYNDEYVQCHGCRFVTLRPGDTVLTGTPPGVGCFRKPPLYLKVIDIVCRSHSTWFINSIILLYSWVYV